MISSARQELSEAEGELDKVIGEIRVALRAEKKGAGYVLRGEKNGRVYRLGDRVDVQVIRVDLERRQIDLGLTEILDAVRRSERQRGPRHARTGHRPDRPTQDRPARRRGRPGRHERQARRGRR